MGRGLIARTLLGAMAAIGITRAWRFAHRRRVLILTVHGVMDDRTDAVWRPLRSRLSPSRLDECLATLRRHYTFVTLGDAVDMLTGAAPLREYCAVLTFDDGYRNQIADVAPVLQKHGVPATVFVPTGFVDAHRPFWFDRVDYALQAAGSHVSMLTIAGRDVPVSAESRTQLAAAYADVRRVAKSLTDDAAMQREVDRIADELERRSGRRLQDVVDRDPWTAVLNSGEIAAAPPLLAFGSHTVDHCRIARLPVPIVVDQLVRSKAAIERWTGRPCRFFCYPDGDWSPAAADLVKVAGYDAAVTTDRGLNQQGDDPMRLRRFDLPEAGTDAELLAEVSGLLDALLRMRGGRMRGDAGKRPRHTQSVGANGA